MPTNTIPIFTLTPKNGVTTTTLIKTAMAAGHLYDGTDGNVVVVLTANTNGSYVERIRAVAAGSCTASVLRIFRNNGSTLATATNNNLIAELSLPTTTATQTAATTQAEVAIGMMLEPSYQIAVGLGTTVSAGWYIQVYSADY